MNAFIVANVKIKNPEKFQEYAQLSGPTFSPYGGELLLKGKFVESLTGETEHSSLAIIKFPTLEKLDAWYQSEEYQSLIPLRDDAAVVQFSKYEIPQV